MQIVNNSYTELYVIVTNRNEISQTIIVNHHVHSAELRGALKKLSLNNVGQHLLLQNHASGK